MAFGDASEVLEHESDVVCSIGTKRSGEAVGNVMEVFGSLLDQFGGGGADADTGLFAIEDGGYGSHRNTRFFEIGRAHV